MQAVKISSDTYLLGYSCTHKNTDFTVNSKTRLIIGDFSVPLGDENLEESKASTEQLISFAEIAGLPLGKKTDFLQIENRIIAIPQNSDDKEFNALTLPFKIHFFGNEWEDIDVTDMTEISKQLILDTVIKKYPEFKDRCVAQVKDNLVCISISLDTDKDLKNSVKNGKKEETYKVDDKTVIKFYGMTVDTGLQPGNYTAKDICKAMEKAGISECKMTSTIIMKQIGNTIMTGVKFGGTKGAADFLTQNELELIRQPFSNFEKDDTSVACHLYGSAASELESSGILCGNYGWNPCTANCYRGGVLLTCDSYQMRPHLWYFRIAGGGAECNCRFWLY